MDLEGRERWAWPVHRPQQCSCAHIFFFFEIDPVVKALAVPFFHYSDLLASPCTSITCVTRKRKDQFIWRVRYEKQNLSRESRKRLPRTCGNYEESVAKKQIEPLKFDVLSCNRRGIPPSTVSQLLPQIQDLQNKVNSLCDARDFSILTLRAALEYPTFQVIPCVFRVPEE